MPKRTAPMTQARGINSPPPLLKIVTQSRSTNIHDLSEDSFPYPQCVASPDSKIAGTMSTSSGKQRKVRGVFISVNYNWANSRPNTTSKCMGVKIKARASFSIVELSWCELGLQRFFNVVDDEFHWWQLSPDVYSQWSELFNINTISAGSCTCALAFLHSG